MQLEGVTSSNLERTGAEVLDDVVEAAAGTHDEVGLRIGVEQIEVRGSQIEEVARAFLLPPTTFEEFDEYVTVHSENACFACSAYLYMALLNLRERGLLEKNSGLHIVVGAKNYIPDEWDTGKNLLLLGNCVSKWKHLGLYGEGCPPNWAFRVGVLKRDLSAEARADMTEVELAHPTKNEKMWNRKGA